MRRQIAAFAMLIASALLSGCKPSKPIHLGSLNEAGTPNEFLASLQTRVKDGPSDVKTRQAVEGIRISVDQSRGTLELANASIFYIGQLSFECEVQKDQPVYFTWDTGTMANNIWQVDWLAPQVSRPVFAGSHEQLLLLHNQPKDNESLGASQLAWLIHNYKFRNCKALDIADATEDAPIETEIQAGSQNPIDYDALAKKDGGTSVHSGGPWEDYQPHGGKGIPFPDGSYHLFPKDASDDSIRSAVLKTSPRAFDLADSFNIDPPDKSQGWQAFAGCTEARRFATTCSAKSFKADDGFASLGGYQTPLPRITNVPRGATLEPNQRDCDAAFQWKNYCSPVKAK